MKHLGIKNIVKECIDNLDILSLDVLSPEEIKKCIEQYKSEGTTIPKNEDFRGRGAPVFFKLNNGLSVVLRKNYRGGLFGKFVKNLYLCSFNYPDSTRLFKEFYCLKKLRESGIPVPDPIMALVEKCFFVFYKGGLITRELKGTRTLLSSVESLHEDNIREHAFSVGLWACRALEIGYVHPDLHLGNVLVRDDGGVSLIDFDKFRICKNFHMGVSQLIKRWNRGVDKRVEDSLKRDILKESFLSGLRYAEQA